ncbi:dihydrofolate reductase family protein [Pseudonocardia sp. DSM 110487]|uniref:dihydrofolate reductase family protein n=1 Tax=Pseudonocardia sp. DSM 110487 TaxID=2865833 RepID=UPI001C695852|nr:dihydrofolate reductase family protein [Pseudonocardia sp. DSM 110487]QYN38696.1 dihydrofolate reductase family protein [Pseudonocardia sp. DSM 110487]
MGNVIVIEYVTLDGVVEDPDGSGGTPAGGWMFRHGPEPVEGDKFGMGPVLDTGVMLLGRTTWDTFSKIWPSRTDEFSTALNNIPKVVASRSLTSTDAWQNSSLIKDDVISTVRREDRDVIVTGSLGIVRELAEHDLIDEYRLIVLPTVAGTGRRLFADGTPPVDLELTSVEQKGAGVLLRYRRAR